MKLTLGYNLALSLNKFARDHIPNTPNRSVARHWYDGIYENPGLQDYYIKDEILGYFIRRTNEHRLLVKKIAELYEPGLSFHPIIQMHDSDKLLSCPKVMAAWAMLTWKIQVLKSESDLAEELECIIVDLVNNHKLQADHHPEFWERLWLMPKFAMAHMCFDYLAMGAEKFGGQIIQKAVDDAIGYFDNNKRKQLEWAKRQLQFIDETFNRLRQKVR